MVMYQVDLKQVDSQIFTWEQQSIWDMWFNGEPPAIPEKQRRGVLFHGLGRRYCKQKSIRRNWKTEVKWLFIIWVMEVSHWLSCYWQGEIFSSSCWGSNVVLLPVRNVRYISSFWSQECVLSDTCESSLF